MKYRVIDRPHVLRHEVDAEQQPDGTWRLIDFEGAESYASDEDFRRFYEPSEGEAA